MYTPTYLSWLDAAEKHANGWPKFVTPEAQRWCVERVLEIAHLFDRPSSLEAFRHAVFLHENGQRPECIQKVPLMDAQFAITYRALLEAGMRNVWMIPASFRRYR